MKVFTKKLGMTQIFTDAGALKPVTILELSKTIVLRKKTVAKDGYGATIIGMIKDGFITKKSVQGQFKEQKNVKKIIEDRIDSQNTEVGAEISINDFKEGDSLTIHGVSKGKGFAGTVKRHSFATGPKTHGSHNYRAPGSIGPTYPQRTILGKKMAGHMGATNSRIKNLKIVRIEKDLNRIWVSGSVPGPNKGCIIVEKND